MCTAGTASTSLVLALTAHLFLQLLFFDLVASFISHQTETKEQKKTKFWSFSKSDPTKVNHIWAEDWTDYKNNEWQIVVINNGPESSPDQKSSSEGLRASGRFRRSTSDDGLKGVEDFHFVGFGRHFHLKMAFNHSILAPNFLIYHNTPTGALEPLVESVVNSSCHHFVGRLKSSTTSIAALTDCSNQGLSGYIRTSEEDFFLEPTTNAPISNQYYLYRKFRQKPRLQGHSSRKKHGNSAGKSRQPRAARFGERKNIVAEEPLKTVEVLMALDQNMVQRHGRTAATTLAFTVFNMVSALFQDASIGYPIHLVLVALLLLEHEQPGFPMSHNAQHLLHHFCTWQATLLGTITPDSASSTARYGNAKKKILLDKSKFTFKTKEPKHDHAVLLTALNFCAWKDQPCDTLGYAPISGMCQFQRSCSISKDTGLSAAYTIAHEIGHNLGMIHDGEGSECPLNSGNLMSPSLHSNDGVVWWSECSRRELQNFLQSDQSRCLDNRPLEKVQLHLPPVFPGQMYDGHAQCQLQFGSKSKVCPFNVVKSICQTLWCQVSGRKCESKFLPAAEGTPCGSTRWCRKGECVPHGNSGPPPVHGQWSGWSLWSSCSRTCGGGVSKRSRRCDNPKARYGGKYCSGNSTEYQLCNMANCPADAMDIREMQCLAFNKKAFRGHFYAWTAYTDGFQGHSRCKLYCRANGWGFIASLSEKVIDGTPCNSGANRSPFTSKRDRYYTSSNDDRCVEGRCRRLGCDGRFDSGNVLDSCGVCGGNGLSCQKPNQIDNAVPQDAPPFYSSHTSEGARVESGIKTESTYCDSGLSECHQRKSCLEQNQCAPYWVAESWSQCVGCQNGGEGIQKRKVSCHVQLNGTMAHRTGRRRCMGPRPIRKRICTCPTRWVVGSWQSCLIPNGKCGVGKKNRLVTCRQKVRETDVTVSDHYCLVRGAAQSSSPPPVTSVSCRIPCTGRWLPYPWSQCSVSCGGGWKVRRVACLAPTTNAYTGKPLTCPTQSKPRTLSQCNPQRCSSITSHNQQQLRQ